MAAALPAAEPGPAPAMAASPTPPPRPAGLIEIILPGGASVRVDAEADARALRRVLSALQSGDDARARPARLFGVRRHRHAEGDDRTGDAGAA